MTPDPEHSGSQDDEEIMNIAQAPHGINLVVETKEMVYIGRFDTTNGFQVLMHDVAAHSISECSSGEDFIRQTAKYGIPVEHHDLVFPAQGICRVRRLGDIVK